MSQSDLHHFFSPKSVAIVGVSSDFHKVGHLVAKNMLLQGYIHDLYFINPKGGRILGRESLTSLSKLDTPVDLAVFCTPADVTLDELERSTDYFSHAVILAAGFKEEHGDEQKKREDRLRAILARKRVRILGPNCAGFVNTTLGLNSTFLVGPAAEGNVGFISQSGALGSILIDTFAADEQLGFSYLFSLGNKSDIDESDALEYLAQDKHTAVIALYLEDVHDGHRFVSALSDATRHKPVIIIKAGASTQGAQAASSHTGSLAGDDVIFDSVVHECGAIRARSIRECIHLIKMASYHVVPKGPQMRVITNAGGCGVLAADAIEKAGLCLAHLYVHDGVSTGVAIPNPLDVRGDADAAKFASAAVLDPAIHIDGALVIVTPQANTQLEETAKLLVGLSTTLPYPIYPVFLGASSLDTVRKICESNRVPFFTDLDELISSLGRYAEQCQRPAPHPLRSRTHAVHQLPQSVRVLPLSESYAALQQADLPMLPIRRVCTTSDLHRELTDIHYPIVMKVSSTTVSHKSDVGGVRVGITSSVEAEQIYTQMSQIRGFEHVLIQEQISGYELIIGAKRDPLFGPVIVMGLGGVLTNLVNESVRFVCPLNQEYVQYIISHSKLRALITGYRGAEPVHMAHLFDLLAKLAHLMTASDRIQEIDLNPVMIKKDGTLIAVDARVVVGN